MSERWWLRPKWVAGHVLCLLLIVTFVNLGLWQLRRLDERRDRNALIESRMEERRPRALGELLAAADDDLRYWRVTVIGRWLPDETVIVRARALAGQPGYHAVTPLATDEGVLIVNRGFLPRGRGDEDRLLADATPPDERVRIEGVLRPTEQRGRLGPADTEGGEPVVNRIAVDSLAQDLDVDVVPGVYLQLTEPAPAGGLPAVLPLPDTDEGPHRSYAVQWFLFATVGAVGWPLLLRRTVRDLQDEPAQREAYPHAG